MIGWAPLPLPRSQPASVPVDSKATDPPPRLEPHERAKVRAAAFRATRLYGGAVGELISKELLSWEEFGMRMGTGPNGLIARVVDEIIKAPLVPK